MNRSLIAFLFAALIGAAQLSASSIILVDRSPDAIPGMRYNPDTSTNEGWGDHANQRNYAYWLEAFTIDIDADLTAVGIYSRDDLWPTPLSSIMIWSDEGGMPGQMILDDRGVITGLNKEGITKPELLADRVTQKIQKATSPFRLHAGTQYWISLTGGWTDEQEGELSQTFGLENFGVGPQHHALWANIWNDFTPSQSPVNGYALMRIYGEPVATPDATTTAGLCALALAGLVALRRRR